MRDFISKLPGIHFSTRRAAELAAICAANPPARPPIERKNAGLGPSFRCAGVPMHVGLNPAQRNGSLIGRSRDRWINAR
jgi:hypothetical protein